jgi:hypothetical protein
MKTRLHTLFLYAAMLAGLGLAPPLLAEPVTIVGPVVKIELAKDGKSANALLKDNKTGSLITIHVTDDLTLDKFKDKRIQSGDEIRTRFDKGEKNQSKSFKKTAGC